MNRSFLTAILLLLHCYYYNAGQQHCTHIRMVHKAMKRYNKWLYKYSKPFPAVILSIGNQMCILVNTILKPLPELFKLNMAHTCVYLTLSADKNQNICIVSLKSR